MNACRAKKRFSLPSGPSGLAGALGLSLCVSACASPLPFNQPVDPASPAAARIEALVAENRTYPRWADFPAAPTGLPAPYEIATEVVRLEATQDALAEAVSRIQWTLNDPEGFAESTRSRIDPSRTRPISGMSRAEYEAWARALRQRATPPPPLTRR
ncbi:MAG: hypothetical protein ACK4E3_00535 [Brevundimonas sp.]|uniref:hypothetical protein n=1 Tax=Brevundimonas sp. TaxID=1871086 RepID=UPI00391B7D17